MPRDLDHQLPQNSSGAQRALKGLRLVQYYECSLLNIRTMPFHIHSFRCALAPMVELRNLLISLPDNGTGNVTTPPMCDSSVRRHASSHIIHAGTRLLAPYNGASSSEALLPIPLQLTPQTPTCRPHLNTPSGAQHTPSPFSTPTASPQ